MKIFARIIQVVIILIPCGLFFWLFNIAVVPSGVFVTSRNVNESSPYLDRLLPDARVEETFQESDGNWVQKIIGDPVFFFVHPQRSFDSIVVEYRFKNKNTPIVEAGLLADATTGAYQLEPLQNLIIDNSLWNKISIDDTILLQRQKNYETLASFLANPPALSEIAIYHYDLARPYRLSDYVPSFELKSTNVSLRGSHEFYTYIKNETLNFKFSFSDTNRQVGEDWVDIVVTNEAGQPVAEERAYDDGNTTNNSSASSLQTLIVSVPNLSEGVYKVQMKATEDIFFRAISTSQQKMTFLNQIWLADTVGYLATAPTVNFWTEGKNLKLSTRHATGAQTVSVGRGTVAITQPYLEYSYAPPETGVVAGRVPAAEDLLIRADGHFAFSYSQFFNPDPLHLTAETDLDRAGVNYIIADYTPPERAGEWLVATATFPTANVPFVDQTWKLAISAPTVNQSDRELLLNSIKIKFVRQPTTFSELVKKVFDYVF
ncbi:MAG: hypothetical protein WC702_01575 [Patescibacteria group bacterium]|jgi:hypothetical protein